MSTETGYVYVIGIPAVQAVKIGWTADVASRLSGLQTGCPLPLVLMWKQEVAIPAAVEVALHLRFSDKRVRGEWFDLGPDAVRLVREACEEITADLPVSALSAAAEKDLGYDPYVLSPEERVWRDAGRWYDRLAEYEYPEYVTAEELVAHVRAFTDEPLWSELSDHGTCRLVREAYAKSRLKVPPHLQVDGNRIPVDLIAGVWTSFKRQATWDPRLAPHCGISPEAAEAKRAELKAAVEAKRRSEVSS